VPFGCDPTPGAHGDRGTAEPVRDRPDQCPLDHGRVGEMSRFEDPRRLLGCSGAILRDTPANRTSAADTSARPATLTCVHRGGGVSALARHRVHKGLARKPTLASGWLGPEPLPKLRRRRMTAIRIRPYNRDDTSAVIEIFLRSLPQCPPPARATSHSCRTRPRMMSANRNTPGPA